MHVRVRVHVIFLILYTWGLMDDSPLNSGATEHPARRFVGFASGGFAGASLLLITTIVGLSSRHLDRPLLDAVTEASVALPLVAFASALAFMDMAVWVAYTLVFIGQFLFWQALEKVLGHLDRGAAAAAEYAYVTCFLAWMCIVSFYLRRYMTARKVSHVSAVQTQSDAPQPSTGEG